MQKFKAIVENSNTIAIRVGKTDDISKILAGVLLHQVFSKLGKKVNTDIKNGEIVAAFFDGGIKNFEKEENILIKFDTEKLPVSELRYEKEGKFMKIILKSGSAAPDLREVLVEKEALPADLLMLVDTPEAEIERALKENPHKEVVRLGTKDKNLSLKIEEILGAFFEEIPTELKEAFWFFANYEKRTEWNLGGLREEKILQAKEALFGPSFWKLLGRALSRSHFEKEIQTLWAFLPKSDFSAIGGPAFGGDAGTQTCEVIKVLNELRALRPESKIFALLWENAPDGKFGADPKAVSAMIASRDPALLKNLAASMSGAPASSYFIANGFSAFSEAEIKIRGLIRRVL